MTTSNSIDLSEIPANKVDYSMSMAKINVVALALAIPILSIILVLYTMFWGVEKPISGVLSVVGQPDRLLKADLIFLGILILGTILHELIHGLTWMIASKKPLSALKFGFQVKTLTPYAHFREPLPVNAYRLGTVMPGLVTGVVPAIIGLATGNTALTLLSALFILAASGDFTILWLIRKVTTPAYVEDHPTRAGCYVYQTEPIKL